MSVKRYGRTSFVMLMVSGMVFLSSASAEEKILAGVAANYTQPFKELSAVYEKQTGIRVEAVFTSSGNLYNQINNGAPYDILLSADNEKPGRLYREGLAKEPFTYAAGQVILWSASKDFCHAGEWTRALNERSIKKIAIANPETAPYGLSAMKALQKTGQYWPIRPKLVYSQDIAQAFQYASTEAVDAGFCALSAAFSEKGRAGCYYIIDEAPPIIQAACVLKSSKNSKGADSFAAFLVSKAAIDINKKYGYR